MTTLVDEDTLSRLKGPVDEYSLMRRRPDDEIVIDGDCLDQTPFHMINNLRLWYKHY